MLKPLLVAAFLAYAGLSPAHAVETPRRSLTQCLADLLCFQGLDFGDRFELRFRNDSDQPFTVAVNVRTKDGSNRQKSLRFLSRSPERRLLLTMPFAPGKAAATWAFTYHPGSEPAVHDDGHVYRLPYESGTSHIVSQGHDGDLTHSGALRHAIDWRMPVGTPVLAARAGTVIGAFDGSDVGGTDAGMHGRENFLWLRHDDGTVGQYHHLAHDSIAVGLGARVETGQHLALSGNTGYSSEPHLHFHVSTPTETGPHAFETFPARFRFADGRVGIPQFGKRYGAP